LGGPCDTEDIGVVYGPLLVNALVEGWERWRDLRDLRLEPERNDIDQRRVEDALKGLKDGGWRIAREDEAFETPSAEEREALRCMHFPKCMCRFLMPPGAVRPRRQEDLEKLARLIVYHECNSVSELYNRWTLFVVPFVDREVCVAATARDNRLNRLKSEDKCHLRATLIIALEFERSDEAARFHGVGAILALSSAGALEFDRMSPKIPRMTQEKLQEGATKLFHMRKTFLDREEFRGLVGEALGALRKLADALGLGGGRILSADEVEGLMSRPGSGRRLYDLHDVQIGAVLGAFSAFAVGPRGGGSVARSSHSGWSRIYDDMRDDVRSNAFSAILLYLDRRPSDDFLLGVLEGYRVRLRGDGRALGDYRVGYEDEDTNFYLSWNSLLILKTGGPSMDSGKDALNFLKFALPRALVAEMLAGELLYLNSLYSELLKDLERSKELRSKELGRAARERAREIYVRTALTFDLGYVQVPLIRKILERIVETYRFKATLDGIKSALSALDASISAEAAEKLNVIILIVSIYAALTAWLLGTHPEYSWLTIVALPLVALPLYVFWDNVREIYCPKGSTRRRLGLLLALILSASLLIAWLLQLGREASWFAWVAVAVLLILAVACSMRRFASRYMGPRPSRAPKRLPRPSMCGRVPGFPMEFPASKSKPDSQHMDFGNQSTGKRPR